MPAVSDGPIVLGRGIVTRKLSQATFTLWA